MTSPLSACRRLCRNDRGAVLVEFALLAPVLIVMMLGVLQVGLTMQNYNAVRNVSADIARYAMIQYTDGHPITADALEAHTLAVAEASPYLLSSDRITVHATDVATPQVTGTAEKTLTISYQIPTVLDNLGLRGPSISYSRSLIVTPSA